MPKKMTDEAKWKSFLARYKAREAKCLERYGLECSCCGLDEPTMLTVDYADVTKLRNIQDRVDGGVAVLNRQYALYGQIIKNNFPEGFITFCMNCFVARNRTEDGTCYHQRRASQTN